MAIINCGISGIDRTTIPHAVEVVCFLGIYGIMTGLDRHPYLTFETHATIESFGVGHWMCVEWCGV